MKRMLMVAMPAFMLLCLAGTGCIAVRVSGGGDGSESCSSRQRRWHAKSIERIEPVVNSIGDHVVLSVNLHGDFSWTDVTTYSKSGGDAKYLSMGFYPGVMACEGGIGDSLRNAAVATWYNFVLGFVPTVYGLVVAPFVPSADNVQERIRARNAFSHSPIMGFCWYTRYKQGDSRDQEVNEAKRSYLLEGAALRLCSDVPYRIDENSIMCGKEAFGKDGVCPFSFRVPSDHPFKEELRKFEDIQFDAVLRQ